MVEESLHATGEGAVRNPDVEASLDQPLRAGRGSVPDIEVVSPYT